MRQSLDIPRRLSAFVFLVVLIAVSSLPVWASAIPPPTPSVAPCLEANAAAYGQLDVTAATQSAMSWPLYATATSGVENLKYYSIFETGVSSPPSCNSSELKVNVVFGGQNSLGFAYYVVTENASTLAPISISVQQNPGTFAWGCSGNTCNEGNWAGYEVYANSGHTTNIWQATIVYNQSAAGYPSTGCGTIGYCAVGTWTGLEDAEGASDSVLAQDGTAGKCTGSGCTPSYFAWYEMLPAKYIACTGVTINEGDYISATVMSSYIDGGSKTNYRFEVTDDANGQYCLNAATYTALSNPTIATFITEDPALCNSQGTACPPLAKFGDVFFSQNEVFASGTYNWINYFTSQGYYWKDVMQNAPGTYPNCGTYVTNVSPGSVGSEGAFNTPWDSSANTPPYISLC